MSTAPMPMGMGGMTSGILSGPMVQPMNKKLMAMVEGSVMMRPAIRSEVRSAMRESRVMKLPPTRKEMRSWS